MNEPKAVDNPFYKAGPSWARWPLTILATMATSRFIFLYNNNFFSMYISISIVIASQAIITGVFSLISQACSLEFSPPFRVIHTSKKMIGQIYVPVSTRQQIQIEQKRYIIVVFSGYQLDHHALDSFNYSLFPK